MNQFAIPPSIKLVLRKALYRRPRPGDHPPSKDSARRDQNPSPARWWADRLWLGFTEVALTELSKLSTAADQPASVRANAFLQLGRWSFIHDHVTQAYEYAVLSRVASGNLPPQAEQPALEFDCLIDLGRIGEATTVLDRALVRSPRNPHLQIRRTNVTPRGSAARLAALNARLSADGCAQLDTAYPAHPVSLDNLTARANPVVDADAPLVSVIVATYNCERTIPTALRGLQQQSWRNLEIIVVDDASSDDSPAIAARFAGADDRIRILRQSKNHGAYAARNVGLNEARGDLITVHDADDWSHPDKITVQVRAILDNPGARASASSWVRSDNQLQLSWPVTPATRIITLNYSSLMVTRATVQELGQWDDVAVYADVEYVDRLRTVFGDEAIIHCLPETPLAFGRRDGASLSWQTDLAGSTHLEAFGARRVYRDAYRGWHHSPSFAQSLPLNAGSARPFPIPHALGHQRHVSALTGAVVILFDCAESPSAAVATEVLRRVSTSEEHLPSTHLCVADVPSVTRDVTVAFPSRFLDAMRSTNASFITVGDPIIADRALVIGNIDLAPFGDRIPKIEASNVEFIRAGDIDMPSVDQRRIRAVLQGARTDSVAAEKENIDSARLRSAGQ